MNKKKHITVSQIYFANMGYYFIESRGKKKVSIWMLFMKSKKKMKQHIYE